MMNDNGTPTLPNTGGSGGTITMPDQDPCKILKTTLNRNVTNTTPNTVVGLLQNLRDNLPANNPQTTGEIGIVLLQTSNGLEANLQQETMIEDQINFQLNVGGYYPAVAHIHDDGLSVPSLADIYFMVKALELNHFDENSFSFVITHYGTKYAFRIKDANALNLWASQFFAGWDLDLPTQNNPMIKTSEDNYAEKVNKNLTTIQNEIGFVQFLKEKNSGLEVLKAKDESFTQWEKLTYNESTNNVDRKPCN